MSKVKCNFCKKEFNEITTGHLRKCCGLDLNEYVKMFPDSKISSERTKNVNCYFYNYLDSFALGSPLNDSNAGYNRKTKQYLRYVC